MATTASSPTLSSAYRAGVEPRQTFADGYIDNAIIDAAYRSMEVGTWVPVDMSAI